METDGCLVLVDKPNDETATATLKIKAYVYEEWNFRRENIPGLWLKNMIPILTALGYLLFLITIVVVNFVPFEDCIHSNAGKDQPYNEANHRTRVSIDVEYRPSE